ncbi:HlyD family efflux transporter periplasmic adaptor subunit [Lentimicrobium sp. L6]|uniref:efflux RND transporter periplasmic adaptor subunit n=1 Tax=Lentimicrobium sp. L6 TaxID=2735916 RepID=UPI001554C1AD|nr:HlyD family efflux transporter periplasmic adaptor subunit [Lentimicrobium sp. L6]NPD84636.1 HlyD family efflux transporter periplasmic adaptor subunit [Lentimicrobium sp. L6]
MDRELSKDFVIAKRKKRLIKFSIIIVIIILPIWYIIDHIKPSVELKKVLLSTVSVGEVENSFSSNATIEPYYQELLTSSISTEILEINKAAGDIVGPNDTLFIPNVEDLISQKIQIEREIALKLNSISRSQEELQQKRRALRNNLKKDSIQLQQLQSQLEKEKYLFNIGGGSQQKVDQAQIDYQLSSINRNNQKGEFESFKKLQKLDLERMELELQLKKQEKMKMETLISQAFVQPKINGIITSILVQPGEHVSEGQALAHVADAQRFKIEGSISTRYADKVYVGQKALVDINDSILHGLVTAISPSVDNGSISYTVNLENPQHRLLKAKLKVEVRIILSEQENRLRIANGDYYFGPGYTDLFVKMGDQLEKRKVKLGGANFDFVEVIAGLQEGEIVIISNAFNEKHKKYNSLSWSE